MSSQSNQSSDTDFIEHLSTIQSIIDSWVALLDPKHYRQRIPDPLNYLTIIVLGDEQSGKTTFIESILGIQLKPFFNDQDSEDTGLNSSLTTCDADSGILPASKHRPRDFLVYDDTYVTDRNITSKLSGNDFGSAPRRVCSSYSTTMSTPLTRQPAHATTSSVNYATHNYSDFHKYGLPSPRSTTSTGSRVAPRQRPSVMHLRKNRKPSCLPTVISMKRGPEAYFIAVPVRESIISRIIVSDTIIKPSSQMLFSNTPQTESSGLFSARVDTSSMLINPLSLLLHLEKSFSNTAEYQQALAMFRLIVEQDEVVELFYILGQSTAQRPAEPTRRQSAIKPLTLIPSDSPNPFNSPLNEDAGLMTYSPGAEPPLAGRRVSMAIRQNHLRSKSTVMHIKPPNEQKQVAFLQFQIATLRYVPHIISFAKFLESVADATDLMGAFPQMASLEATACKDELIQIHITGPKLPNLRVIEVPGGTPDSSGSDDVNGVSSGKALEASLGSIDKAKIRERAKLTLRDYALDRTALFVNIIDANQTMNLYFSAPKSKTKMPDSLRWVVELEPQGTRTLIVLSKLDLVRNFGQLVTSLLAENLPWGKDYERRASAMFYKRYFANLNLLDKNLAHQSSHTATGTTTESLSQKPNKIPPPRRLSFKSLGLHHPKVVCLSFLNQQKAVFREIPVFASESNDIPPVVANLYQKFANYESEYLSRFRSLMSEHFDTYFGFKCLTQSLTATVCMTIGSQCMEPAAIVLTREMKRLAKKLDTELQRTAIVSPADRFAESMKKFRDQIETFLTTDSQEVLKWAETNQINTEKQLDNHMLASTAPLTTVLSSAAYETEQRLMSLDDNTALTEYYRNNMKSRWTEQDEKLNYHKVQADFLKNIGKDSVLKEKLRIIVDICRLEFEKMLKRCGSYLKTCLQSFIRSSFGSEHFTEDQLLSTQAIITGLYQSRVLLVRKELRTQCEEFFFSMLDRLNADRKINSYTITSNLPLGENLLEYFQTYWHQFFKSLISFLVTSFLNFKEILLFREDFINETSTQASNEWFDSLKRIFITDAANTTHNPKTENLVVRAGLFRRVMEQLEANIERYPLLYHFCIASVTVSQVDHQAIAERAQKELKGIDFYSRDLDGLVDSIDPKKASALNDDKTDTFGLMNAKTLSYICSGSIGAALLYSFAKK